MSSPFPAPVEGHSQQVLHCRDLAEGLELSDVCLAPCQSGKDQGSSIDLDESEAPTCWTARCAACATACASRSCCAMAACCAASWRCMRTMAAMSADCRTGYTVINHLTLNRAKFHSLFWKYICKHTIMLDFTGAAGYGIHLSQRHCRPRHWVHG